MITATCVEKLRDKNGNIKGYILQDINGVQMKFSSEQVKQAIFLKQLTVNNLKLTSNGRLISTDKTDDIILEQEKNKIQGNAIDIETVTEYYVLVSMEDDSIHSGYREVRMGFKFTFNISKNEEIDIGFVSIKNRSNKNIIYKEIEFKDNKPCFIDKQVKPGESVVITALALLYIISIYGKKFNNCAINIVNSDFGDRYFNDEIGNWTGSYRDLEIHTYDNSNVIKKTGHEIYKIYTDDKSNIPTNLMDSINRYRGIRWQYRKDVFEGGNKEYKISDEAKICKEYLCKLWSNIK